LKILTTIKYVFSLVGLGFLVGAAFLYHDTSSFLAQATRANGSVSNLVRNGSTTYAPVIDFVDNNGKNIEFTSSSGSNPPSYSVGDEVEVYYLATDPQGAKIDGSFSLWGGVIVLGALGSVFSLIGFGIAAVMIFKGRSEENLKKHGVCIDTKFHGIEINEGISINGKNPYRLIAQWLNPDTSKIHVFKSANLWFDPTDYVTTDMIKVFIKSGHPNKYYVDISFLPKLEA
jgi:hypothetical protein